MHSDAFLARALAASFTAGKIEVEQLVERAARLLGRRWRWLKPLAQRVVEQFGKSRPRQAALTKFILADAGFSRACERYSLRPADLLANPLVMSRVAAAKPWPLFPMNTLGELAQWLEISFGELEWFAGSRNRQQKPVAGKLQHYGYRILSKRFGQIRLIESPKPRLKQIQRRILQEILNFIPPHAAAHGFRRERSIVSFAAPHVGQSTVLKIDLQDFFPSISAARIQALFRTAGYPESVADSLAGLCCNISPHEVWRQHPWPLAQIRKLESVYGKPHLPQGAPTSPALANLAAYRLDCRLAGLAEAAGAAYTRYADDLVFSGGETFSSAAYRFHLQACAIAMDEGFAIHHGKTRIMRSAACQRIAGVVVNQRLNVPRSDFDQLKAILTNCIRHGPVGQNHSNQSDFRAHLAGRISYVEMLNPARGRKLRLLFDRISW